MRMSHRLVAALIAPALAFATNVTAPDTEPDAFAAESAAVVGEAHTALGLSTDPVGVARDGTASDYTFESTVHDQVVLTGDAETATIHIEGSAPVTISLPTTADLADAVAPTGDRVVDPSEAQAYDDTAEVDVDGAVRAHSVIRDADAPEVYVFTVSTDEPADRILLPDGSVAFFRQGTEPETATEDDLLGLIDAPWAVDAAGVPVPTRYEIDGDAIVQVVEHRSATSAYPVTADPAWFIPVLALAARGGMVAWRAARAVTFFRAGSIVAGRYSTTNGFATFARFKTRYGTRSGYDWHHIVEQKHAGRFVAEAIHNPNNLVQIPRKIHQQCVNSIMGSKRVNGPGFAAASGLTMRQTVDRMGNWGAMHRTGVAILRYCGVNL